MQTGETAFDRLHALVRKGYRAELGREPGDSSIRLKHLGKAMDLVLHPDGSIEEAGGRIPRHKRLVHGPGLIKAEKDADHLRFLSYVAEVPKPTLRDRTRPWRKKYVYVPAFSMAFFGLCLSFTAIILSM